MILIVTLTVIAAGGAGLFIKWQVKAGDRMLYGEEALLHLAEPITNSVIDKAFKEHKMEPLQAK